MFDLPSEFPKEPGLPDEYHDLQPLLSATLKLTQYSRQDRFTGTDLNLYYDEDHPLWHKRPDWFLAVNVPRQYPNAGLRLSYVVWDEGVVPSVIVELLSPGTEKQDLGPFYSDADQIDPLVEEQANLDSYLGAGLFPTAQTPPGSEDRINPQSRPPQKWTVYEKILKVPYYIVFSRYTNCLRVFRLFGDNYQEQPLNPDQPRFWLETLNIGIGLWTGEYQGITRQWLRWFDEHDNWILTPEEAERTEKLAALQQLERERQRRATLITQLK
jgi:Uma2 family endonuclease